MFVFNKRMVQTALFSLNCVLLMGCGEIQAPQPVQDAQTQETGESHDNILTQLEDDTLGSDISEDDSSESDISEDVILGSETSVGGILEETLFYKSEYKGTHPYVSGWRVDGSTGQTTPVYSSCGVSINYYRTEEECIDETGASIALTSKEMHSGCGK